MTPWAAYRWLAQLGNKRAGAGENVEANERQVNDSPWGMANLPIPQEGHGGRCAPPYRPDFLGGSRHSAQSIGAAEEKPTPR